MQRPILASMASIASSLAASDLGGSQARAPPHAAADPSKLMRGPKISTAINALPTWRGDGWLGGVTSARSSVASCESQQACGAPQKVTPLAIANKAASQSPDYYYEKLNSEELERTALKDHAVFGSLREDGKVERFNVYKRVETSGRQAEGKKEIALVDVRVGNQLNGNRSIVHGGIITLLLDEAIGWGVEVNEDVDKDTATMTAFIHTNFRAPLHENSNSVIRVYFEERKGRKLYFSGRMESYDGRVLYADANAMFVVAPMSKIKPKPEDRAELTIPSKL